MPRRSKDDAVRLASDLAVRVQRCVERWRAHERHTLGGQLCRAALSVSANLVEAKSRRSARERLRFVEIADGSLREAGHFLGIAREVKLIAPPEIGDLDALHAEATRALGRVRESAALEADPRRVEAALPAKKRGASVPPVVARARTKKATRLSLKPADPFELIRWLARSQSDPRKAVAELVQNSLDADAKHVTVRRQRIRKRLCLVVRDDGDGVLPSREREEALRYLATHVGHSHKMGLDPAERAQRVVAGKYGVGLLGFWSIGRALELRTRVAGSPLYALRLEEDSDKAEIVQLPLATDAPETYTEVVVLDVHPAAQRALGGRRLTDYLAAELRGQLLAHDVELVLHDHVARGLAQKRFRVVPRKFSGERLDVPGEVEVAGGYPPLRVELYLTRGAERPAIEVACAGTLVADDVAELSALGLAVDPWVGRELTGMVDFAAFNVPPGTRRGVMPDAAATAFVRAMETLAPLVSNELDRLDRERKSAADRDVLRELQQALRGLRARLPHFDLPHVRDGEHGVERSREPGAPLRADTEEPARSEGASNATTAELFPPGPLAAVRISPAEVPVAPGRERRVHARCTDRDDRAIAGATLAWTVIDAAGLGVELHGDGPRPAVSVRSDARGGATAELRVDAEKDGTRVSASAIVRVVDPEEEAAAALGIPEPHLVSDPAGNWRSRMAGERWEVNDAHDDYRALRAEPRARLRYLLSLLAREIVLKNAGRPDAADTLDAILDILSHAERNLRGK